MRIRILLFIPILCSMLAGYIVFASDASKPGNIEPRVDQVLRQMSELK
ncbi:MAG: hypothetical protein KJP06_07780 [Deltaproteobacteria bacterium]|nr:hypothetical protein [Deltaproteobacteria bacterium]